MERRRPARLRAAIEARIEALEPAPPSVLLSALGAIDGGLAPARSLDMLDSPLEERRLAAARWARGVEASERLSELARSDPAASVRAAAITRLATLRPDAALADAIRALADPAPEVRLSAARAVSEAGARALPDLRNVVETGAPDAARAAIAALSMMRDEGRALLITFAEEHPDRGLRMLAEIALGRPIGHRD